MVIGVAMGVAISFMSPAKENDNLWFVFACGIIGVSGMTLPGLSGSFILILMGNYVLLLVDSVTMLFKTLTEVFTGVKNPVFKNMYFTTFLAVASAALLAAVQPVTVCPADHCAQSAEVWHSLRPHPDSQSPLSSESDRAALPAAEMCLPAQ